jgi:hypothetical protein
LINSGPDEIPKFIFEFILILDLEGSNTIEANEISLLIDVSNNFDFN